MLCLRYLRPPGRWRPAAWAASAQKLWGRSCATTWQLPEISPAVRAAVGEAVADSLVPREAVLVDSKEDAQLYLPELLGARLLGLDSEGVALGRWGRLCLIQIATTDRVYLFDTLREGVVDVIRPVLEGGGVVKVMHDCREDASALLSQFDVTLTNVFDTQVAHTLLLEQQASRPFQISLNNLLKSTLELENDKQQPLGQKMRDDPNIWFYRPLREDLITYAVQDVMYLPLLHRHMCDALGDPGGVGTLIRSQKYVDYARMNHHLGSPKAVEKRGLRLQAMLATQTDAALYLKLNLGAHRQGAVSRPDAISRFSSVKFGEIIDCWVSAWNSAGNVIFLERLEAETSFPDPAEQRQLTNKRGRRWRKGG